MPAKKPSVAVICQHCRSVRHDTPSRAALRSYCSKECLYAAQRQRQRSRVKVRLETEYDVDGDGCWIWRGSKQLSGYGEIIIGGKKHSTHRLIYEAHYGTITENTVVRHKCDKPSCINPSHLEIGTQADNVADMYARNRGNPWGWKGGRKK